MNQGRISLTDYYRVVVIALHATGLLAMFFAIILTHFYGGVYELLAIAFAVMFSAIFTMVDFWGNLRFENFAVRFIGWFAIAISILVPLSIFHERYEEMKSVIMLSLY